MKKTYKINGLKCAGCAENVQAAFEKVAGVKSVEVNLEEHSATVVGEYQDSELANALANTSYSIA